MKSDGVQRSVRSTRNEREAGDAPDIGRVARIPGTGLPKGKRKKRRTSESTRRLRNNRLRRKVVATWTILIGVAALVSLGVAVWQGMKFGREGEAISTATPAVRSPGEMTEANRVPSLPEDEALALVRRGLALRDPAKLSTYFRPAEVPPARQVEFLGNLENVDGRVDHLEWLGNLDANGLSIDGVLIAFQSDGPPRNRLATLVAGTDGKWKIDFDSLARTVTPSWADFLGASVPVAKVRVYLVNDSYYNGPFRDENEWQCVSLASPDTEEILTGYCRRHSPQGNAMKWLLSKDANLHRAVLEIRRTAGAERRQVEISRVLAEDWATADTPFDEQFK